jgi:hypothetical protein
MTKSLSTWILWRPEPSAVRFICYVFAGGLLLLIGFAYYVLFRSHPPPLLGALNLHYFLLKNASALDVTNGSFPSFIHVAAFGLLTCAVFRASGPINLAIGAFWASVNVLWELSCANHQSWLRLVYERVSIDQVPSCIYDRADIVAAIAGAAVVALVGALESFIRRHLYREGHQ